MNHYETLQKMVKNFKEFLGNKTYYLVICFSLFITLLGTIEPIFASKAIGFVEKYISGEKMSLNNIYIFLSIWILYLLIFYALKFVFRYYIIDKNALIYYVKQENFYKEKVLNITQAKFLEKKGGSFFKIIDRGVESMFAMIFLIFTEAIPQIATIIGVSIFLIYVNFKLAIVTLSLIPVFIILGYYFSVKTRIVQEELHKKWNNFFGILGDYVSNLTLVKILTFEKEASNNLTNLSNETLSLQLPISKRWGIAEVYANSIMSLSRFLLICFGAFLIVQKEIGFATLLMFYLYINYIYYPLSFLFSNLKNLQRNTESIKILYEEFDNIPQDSDFENAKDLKNISGKIEFKNVFFSYNQKNNINGENSENEVIKNISFCVNPGEKIAFVGTTGSGKSTITSLLLRFWEISNGEILIDDINIKNITKSSLRKHIGIVMQDNSLFNTTIKNNMLFANPKATDEEIKEALIKAKADFVFKQKENINTEIGERGLKLSGGEKQRLNIARIILKNPEILVLDEATSALDNKTEIEIQKSLDNLIKQKTSIIIAHRLSTIKKVDKIFVLDKGQIVESGSYQELLSKGGKFFELANPDKMVMN